MQALRFGLYHTEPRRASSSSSQTSSSGRTRIALPPPAYVSPTHSRRHRMTDNKSSRYSDTKTLASHHASTIGQSSTTMPPPSHPSITRTQAPPGYSETGMSIREESRVSDSLHAFDSPVRAESVPIIRQEVRPGKLSIVHITRLCFYKVVVAPMDSSKPRLTPKERRNAKRDELVPKCLRIPILAFSCNSASFALYLPAIFICECGE